MREWLSAGRAMATNVLAGVAPSLYLRLTGQTGRGDPAEESASDVAAYFVRSFDEYLARLGVDRSRAEGFLAGKTVIEYGPGDVPGVAMLFAAYGAAQVICVDRFPMMHLNAKNQEVIRRLQRALPERQAGRLAALVRPEAAGRATLDPDRVRYVVHPHGFSGLSDAVDLAVSRAVLEHVDDLEGTFVDMVRALRPGGQAAHLVDLRSHGLHRRNPLDFLEWPVWAWSAMFSNKGVPNRWRADRYRDIVGRIGVEAAVTEVTQHASAADVAAVRPRLAEPFRGLSDPDLAALGLWVCFRKPA